MGKRIRSKYVKTPLNVKIQLLKKVILEGESIKKVAQRYKINYSTAKTLVRFERQNKNYHQYLKNIDQSFTVEHEKEAPLGKRCSYREIEVEKQEIKVIHANQASTSPSVSILSLQIVPRVQIFQTSTIY